MVRRLCVLAAILALLGAAGTTCALGQQLLVNPPDDAYRQFPSDPQGAIRAARELIAAGKMDQAIAQLQIYVAAHQNEIAPHRFLGDLYVRAGHLDSAKNAYLAILLIAPGDKETHNRLGTVYAVENQIDAAITQFAAALPGTDSVDDLVSLHERRGDLPKYRADVEQMARSNPADPGLQAELGQVYSALHQPFLAISYYQRALDNDSNNLSALNGLGLAYLNLHDFSEAIAQFQKCLMVDNEAYSCADNLGATQLEMGDYKEAKLSLDRAYRMAPERGETFVNYGYLDDAQGNWHDAVTQYARAIATWPYIREAYIDIALAYEDHRLYSLAQQALVKGIASVSDDGRMHFLLGRAYEMEGDRPDALAQFKLAAAGTDPTAERIGAERFAELTGEPVPTPKPQ